MGIAPPRRGLGRLTRQHSTLMSPEARASAHSRASAEENPHGEEIIVERCNAGGGRSGSSPALRTA
jgi:hypothetical protein